MKFVCLVKYKHSSKTEPFIKKSGNLIKEYRVIEKFRAVRYIEEYFDMAYDDEHEPAECYAGMHIAEKFVALPQFYMEKAVAEDIPDILCYRLRGDKGYEKLFPVFFRKLQYDAYKTDDAI